MDPVAICNLALGAIGEKRITSLDDDTASAELCSTLFPEAVRTALEQRAWLFAAGSIDLGVCEESGDASLPSMFELPATVVRGIRCDDGSGTYRLKWERRGSKVFTEHEVPDRVKPWDAATAYAVGAIVTHEDYYWQAVAPVLGAAPADPAWVDITATYRPPVEPRAILLAVMYDEDPALWTPTFCRAVAYLVASDLATGLKENKALSESMYVKYEREISKAGTLDGMQGSSQSHGLHTHSAANRR